MKLVVNCKSEFCQVSASAVSLSGLRTKEQRHYGTFIEPALQEPFLGPVKFFGKSSLNLLFVLRGRSTHVGCLK